MPRVVDLDEIWAYARRVTGRSFASRDVAVLERDGFAVVVLAADLMAYVAGTERSRRTLARQRAILARLAPRVSFPLPRPIGSIDLAGPVDLRERVPGGTGPDFHARMMQDDGLRTRTLAWMGAALAELHAALGELELDALGVPRLIADGVRLRRGIEGHLDGLARERALDVVSRWERRLDDRRGDVLLHGDFGSHNFTFDLDTAIPTGVFDFHDLARGPRAADFKLVPSYGSTSASLAVDRYLASSSPSVELSLEDVGLAHAAAALDYLAWRAEDPEAHDAKSGRDRERAVAWVARAVEDALSGRPTLARA
jgi:aminoglycoside phosphotransferase (APT) family kinase protein